MFIKNIKFIFKVRVLTLLLSLISLGFVYGYTSNNDKLKEAFNVEASFIVMKQVDSLLIKEYNAVNELYKSKEYAKALDRALNLYDLCKEDNNFEIATLTNFLIGNIYEKTNNYRKSLTFYKKVIQSLSSFYSKEGDLNFQNDDNYARTLLKIGGAYQKLRMRDSAKYYYEELNKLNELNESILGYKAASYTNLSGIYQEDSIFDKAELFAKKAIDIYKRRNDKIDQAAAFSNLASLYLSQEMYEKSKTYYLEGIKLIEKDNSAKAVRYKASLYYNLAWAMRNLEDYKAYDYQEKSYDIEDDIRDKELKKMVETITAQYDVKTVRQQEEIKRQKATRNTWIISALSLFIVVVLVFIVKQKSLKAKYLNLEMSRKELVQQQKLEKVKADSQIRILNATIDGKESERKQIAETLHDSVSALLSSANLHLQACKKHFNGSTPLEVSKSQDIINEASQKIRDLSHTLVSSILLKFGLSYAIKDLSEKFSNSALLLDYETKYIKRYDQGFEIKLYNIIQEFINNIIKHSKADYAKVTLTEKKKKLYLIIEDNGQGFDQTKTQEKDGLGINQIDARIKMMQGSFQIESELGKGTKINIELPVFEKKLVTIS